MATYFHGTSEIQADELQTLYLMSPSYVGYTDPQPPASMIFLNSSGNPLNPVSPSQSPQQNQHLLGIPLQATAATAAVHGFLPRLRYNLSTTNAGSYHIPTTEAAAANNSGDFSNVTCQLGLRRSVVGPSQQGLSLSLSSEQPGYVSYRPESDTPAPSTKPVISPTYGDEIQASGCSSSSVSGVSNGNSGVLSVLLRSKYLKAAQQLLEEVVNVGKGIKAELSNEAVEKMKSGGESVTVAGEGSIGGETSLKRGAELTTGEKQELQMKKAKLVSMLDEVERRYRQYDQQMQIVISSFQQAAGFGSAKMYTALALQTISKQFRCLKDTINEQIRAASKGLGEEDCLGAKAEGSRLRLVDQHFRQQRALQQMGMIQHNAWRPQRGLPERSVNILRAWLFENFLHPYPKDSDKLMLARQTGLTRSQVSNWFINARVRLWKPMVEEMYTEETKDQEQNCLDAKTSQCKPNEETASKSVAPQDKNPYTADQTKNLNSKQDTPTDPSAPTTVSSNSTVLTSTMEENIQPQAGFFLRGSSEAEEVLRGDPKKSQNTELQNSPSSIQSMDTDMKPNEINREMCMKFGTTRQSRDGYVLKSGMVNHGSGFGAYPMEEVGRFDSGQFSPRFSGNGVSLTLGLPHGENLPLQGDRHSYLSNQNIQMGRKLEINGRRSDEFCRINNIPPPSHSTTAYENINIQNRKRFAAQLVPDFFA